MRDYLTKILTDFEKQVVNINAIGDVNEDLVKIAVNGLNSLKNDLDVTQGNLGIKAKVDRQLATYQKVARIPELQTKFPIIREQMVVLMVGALEVFISDIYKAIANNNPEFFSWNEKEKIAFDPALLSGGFTMGEIIIGHLKNKGVSFQDLKSTIDSFEQYCGVNIELNNTEKDILVLGTAARHIIVHNRSIIDSQFLKQIRGTEFAVAKGYASGRMVEIDDDFITTLATTLNSFCSAIVDLLCRRHETLG